MSAEPERGTVLATFGGQQRVLRLTQAAIERWEDQHPRGIYGLYYDWVGKDTKAWPTATEMVDLVALALEGGGMAAADARALLRDLGPACCLQCLHAGVAAIEAALTPDAEVAADGAESTGEGKGRAGTMSGK